MKTLTDFRKTVETGVDPRLNINTKLWKMMALSCFIGCFRCLTEKTG